LVGGEGFEPSASRSRTVLGEVSPQATVGGQRAPHWNQRMPMPAKTTE